MPLNRNETGGKSLPGNVAVTSTAQVVVGSRSGRVSLSLRNNGTTTVFLGFSPSLTAANGYPLLTNEEYVFEDYLGAVYVISASTGDLRFFEVY